jgi:hypothetical protein
VLLATTGTSGLVLGTYAFADNMGSPLLLLVMAFALAPVVYSSTLGLRLQGLATPEFATEKLAGEAAELVKGGKVSPMSR